MARTSGPELLDIANEKITGFHATNCRKNSHFEDTPEGMPSAARMRTTVAHQPSRIQRSMRANLLLTFRESAEGGVADELHDYDAQALRRTVELQLYLRDCRQLR